MWSDDPAQGQEECGKPGKTRRTSAPQWGHERKDSRQEGEGKGLICEGTMGPSLPGDGRSQPRWAHASRGKEDASGGYETRVGHERCRGSMSHVLQEPGGQDACGWGGLSQVSHKGCHLGGHGTGEIWAMKEQRYPDSTSSGHSGQEMHINRLIQGLP